VTGAQADWCVGEGVIKKNSHGSKKNCTRTHTGSNHPRRDLNATSPIFYPEVFLTLTSDLFSPSHSRPYSTEQIKTLRGQKAVRGTPSFRDAKRQKHGLRVVITTLREQTAFLQTLTKPIKRGHPQKNKGQKSPGLRGGTSGREVGKPATLPSGEPF